MLKNIQNALFSYDPTEYFPIYKENVLANRGEFIQYKAKKAGGHLMNGMEAIYWYIEGFNQTLQKH